MLGSWEKQRALMAYGGACQVWAEGMTVLQLCNICHPGPCGRSIPLVCRLCGSFVLCVKASLFLYLPLFLSNQRRKVLRVACCIHNRRLPSWSQSAQRRMLRHATASLLFVLLSCNCAGWSCCIQACKKSELLLWDILIRKHLSFQSNEALIHYCFSFFLAICPCIHPHPSIHPSSIFPSMHSRFEMSL